MNKKLISIAVAAAFAAPMAASADTTLYGRINNALVNDDSDAKLVVTYSNNWDETDAWSTSAKTSLADQWDVEDYASRLGVKGSEDLGNGMKAIYQIELQMETSDGGSTSRPVDGFGTRLGYVGLAGGFGTVAVGRQWTPYYGSVDKTDVFQIGATNQAYMGPYRVGDAIAYKTPNMGGFSGALALVVSDGTLAVTKKNGKPENLDHWNASLDWANGPFSVGASYFGTNGSQDSDQWGIGAKYKAGMFAIIGQYEDGDVSSSFISVDEAFDVSDFDDSWDLSDFDFGNADGSAWAIAGQVFFGNNTVTLKYGEKDADDSASFVDEDYEDDVYSAKGDYELEELVIQWEHHFSKRTRVFATYDMTETTTKISATGSYADGEFVETGRATLKTDSDRFGIGIRHDF